MRWFAASMLSATAFQIMIGHHSVQALGDLAGLHATYIGRVERGVQNVTLITVHKIAKALKVLPIALFRGIR